jgi:hypothetical protein
LRQAVGLPPEPGGKQPPSEPASPQEIARLVDALQPELLAAVGLGGLAVIIWLMRFKPF